MYMSHVLIRICFTEQMASRYIIVLYYVRPVVMLQFIRVDKNKKDLIFILPKLNEMTLLRSILHTNI